MYVVHHNTLSDSFWIQIVWFQPEQDSDRIRISFFKHRIESDSKNPLSDHLWQIPNYNFVHVDSLTNAGGVGPYVNKKLQYTVRQGLEWPIDGCECLFFEVKSNNVGGKKCVDGVICRHPSPNSQAFQLAFTNLLEIMHSEKNNYMIGGDTNLNFLKYQIDTHITDYVNSILSLGWISLMLHKMRPL